MSSDSESEVLSTKSEDKKIEKLAKNGEINNGDSNKADKLLDSEKKGIGKRKNNLGVKKNGKDEEKVDAAKRDKKASMEESDSGDDDDDNDDDNKDDLDNEEDEQSGEDEKKVFDKKKGNGIFYQKELDDEDEEFDAPEPAKKPEKKVYGLKLGEIQSIEIALNRFRAEDLKLLHKICYNEPGKISSIKKNVKKFKGFDFEKDSVEYEKKYNQVINEMDIRQLKSVCEMLELNKKSNDCKELATIIMNFLVQPKDPAAVHSSGRPQRSVKTKASYSSADDDDDDDDSDDDDTEEDRKKSIYRDLSDSFDDSDSDVDSDEKAKAKKRRSAPAKRSNRLAGKRKVATRSVATRGKGRPPKSKKKYSSSEESDEIVDDGDEDEDEEVEDDEDPNMSDDDVQGSAPKRSAMSKTTAAKRSEKKPFAKLSAKTVVAAASKKNVNKKTAVELSEEEDEDVDNNEAEEEEEEKAKTDKNNKTKSKVADGTKKDGIDKSAAEVSATAASNKQSGGSTAAETEDDQKISNDLKKEQGTKMKRDAKESLDSSDEEPLAKKSKTTMATTTATGAAAKEPTDEEIKKYIENVLNGANLEKITMKNVCNQVFEHWQDFDLAKKKEFIKSTVKSLISGDESE